MTASLTSLGVEKLDTQRGFSVSCLDSQASLRLRLATVGILDQQIFQDDNQSNVASTRSNQLLDYNLSQELFEDLRTISC